MEPQVSKRMRRVFQTEKPHNLSQGKAQNGITEELLLQKQVSGIANDQAAKHCSKAGP